MNIEDFVVTDDNSLSPSICENLISVFNQKRAHHERFDMDGKPNFTQLNLSEQIGKCDLHDELVSMAVAGLKSYVGVVPEARYWPPKYKLEFFRIKHYRAGGVDQFDTHVDSNDQATSVRFLIFFWYLNKVEKGGETELIIRGRESLVIRPEVGRLVMFPPFWMFPHKGHPVEVGEKYLLSSYLHYDDRGQ